MRRIAVGLLLVASCALLVLPGCGGPAEPKREYADVKGKVSYKGEPLKMGQVIFQPPSGAAATGDIGADGTYSLKGVIGPNQVTITSREQQGEMSADNPKSRQEPKSNIPDKYSTPGGGLKYEVKAGENQADFDLQ